MLWHYRLRHPNFLYLKNLFPHLFNKNSKHLQCEVCQLSKHIRHSYPYQPYKSSHPFYLIHSDVWDPLGLVTFQVQGGSLHLLMTILGSHGFLFLFFFYEGKIRG